MLVEFCAVHAPILELILCDIKKNLRLDHSGLITLPKMMADHDRL